MDHLALGCMLGSLGVVADLESPALGMRKQVWGICYELFLILPSAELHGMHAFARDDDDNNEDGKIATFAEQTRKGKYMCTK